MAKSLYAVEIANNSLHLIAFLKWVFDCAFDDKQYVAYNTVEERVKHGRLKIFFGLGIIVLLKLESISLRGK